MPTYTPILEIAILSLLGLLAGIWWTMRGSPRINPDRCHWRAVREGRTDCGGPCTVNNGKLPCEGPQS